ncbi:MAG: cation-translocating P-type ATPase [Candidatus Paceibacterota bacterium]
MASAKKYRHQHSHQPSTFSLLEHSLFFWLDIGLIAASCLILLLDFFNISKGFEDIVLLEIVSLIGLFPVFLSALLALAKRKLSIDLLASIALFTALVAGEWRSAAFITLMLASARLFARYTGGRARRAIESLLKLRPEKAHVLLPDRKVVEVDIGELKVGDLVAVESGERLAVDGVVESGEADIDQSSLTGESEPVAKKAGDKIFSSTLNIGGSLIVKATKVGTDTTFSKILDLVEQSQASKSPITSMIDRFASWYIFLSLAGAILIFLFTRNLSLVLSILLVTCADDLAIAIPLAFTAAIGAAARRGIIIKGGSFIEGFPGTKIMVFDKTGTLTEGRPAVQNVVVFNHYSRGEFLTLIGAAESESGHPTAKAIEAYAAGQGIKFPKVSDVHESPGYGIKCVVDWEQIFAGKINFLEDNGIKFSQEEIRLVEEEKSKQRTVTVLGRKGKAVGFISLADAIRPAAEKVVADLKKLGVERVIMLTGDNEKIAQRIAQKVGISEFKANLSPEDKIGFLKTILNPAYKVAMAGDGVNDAAALGLVDIGIAMGAIGSDAAVETSDVVLMKDDLSNIPKAIKLSRYTVKIVKQDLWIWGAVNTLGLALVFLGVIGPAAAAAYNFLTDFLPLLNSLKLFRLHFSKKTK